MRSMQGPERPSRGLGGSWPGQGLSSAVFGDKTGKQLCPQRRRSPSAGLHAKGQGSAVPWHGTHSAVVPVPKDTLPLHRREMTAELPWSTSLISKAESTPGAGAEPPRRRQGRQGQACVPSPQHAVRAAATPPTPEAYCSPPAQSGSDVRRVHCGSGPRGQPSVGSHLVVLTGCLITINIFCTGSSPLSPGGG